MVPSEHVIAPMSSAAIAKVRALEAQALKLPQVPIETTHVLHAGLYARTIKIQAGVMITGVLIKIPTLLIVSGKVLMYSEGGAREISGYHVLQAAAGRKQSFVALEDSDMTMLFATRARTVAEAEAAFTDETDALLSRRPANINSLITTEA
jgi:hypothetical protein